MLHPNVRMTLIARLELVGHSAAHDKRSPAGGLRPQYLPRHQYAIVGEAGGNSVTAVSRLGASPLIA